MRLGPAQGTDGPSRGGRGGTGCLRLQREPTRGHDLGYCVCALDAGNEYLD